MHKYFLSSSSAIFSLSLRKNKGGYYQWKVSIHYQEDTANEPSLGQQGVVNGAQGSVDM